MIRGIVTLLFILAFSFIYTFAEEVEVDGKGSSEKYAVKDALKKALHQVITDNVEADKIKKKKKKIKKLVNTIIRSRKKQKEVIRGYEIVEKDEGTVTLNVDVDTDSLLAKLRKKGILRDKPLKKFAGRVILSCDEGSLKKLGLSNQVYRSGQLILRSKLQEKLQARFEIYDATALWESMKMESIRLQESAQVNPTDFLARKFNMATHVIYFWAKTWFKEQKNIGRYCFGEIGIRMVRVNTGEEIARFQLSRTKEGDAGQEVKAFVDRDDDHARKQVLGKLAKTVAKKLRVRLLEEKPEEFLPARKLRIRAGNFASQDLNKLKDLIIAMANDKKITIQGNVESGEGYFQCDIAFPKQEKGEQYNEASFRPILREECEEDGLIITIQSSAGKLLIGPQGHYEDNYDGF